MHSKIPVALLILPLACGAAHAASPTFEWNARLRHEMVHDDAFARDASATTLRLRAGLRWAISPHLTALLEAEGVGAAGDAYNSTANGRTGYPVIADPASAEINQALIRWTAETGEATVGRQRIAPDNQRWIGNVGWRQNEQTFDALAAQWNPTQTIAVRYGWLDRVHRVNSDRALDPAARERRLDGHLLNVGWTRARHRLTGYVYAIEDEDVASASTRTIGARYVSAPGSGAVSLGMTAEAARQTDHARSPLHFAHTYWLAEPSIAMRHATIRAGWEHLGGDGRHALQTPLATLHAFNGWADKFTTTPAAGLEDRYLAINGALPSAGKPEWSIAFHDYRADAGHVRYGREWNASMGITLKPQWRGMVKVADYRAAAFACDTTKLWLQLEWNASAR